MLEKSSTRLVVQAMNIMYLDLSKMFDKISHGFCFGKLENCSNNGWYQYQMDLQF